MSKRSDFPKIEKDAYQTIDLKAVETLVKYLPATSFVEPCVGEGLLVKELLRHKFVLTNSSDIKHGIDALSIDEEYCSNAEYIITNPPWTRKILHPMILHFISLRPTWLLFDADWAHTKQSSELIEHCSKIISVGRLQWIPDTNMSGKDNCAWYLFEQEQKDTIFIGR